MWGGGGLVSTTSDLTRFYEALLAGEVFERADTLRIMQTIPPANRDVSAAMGHYHFEVSGESCWGHDALWSVIAASCPTLGMSVAVVGLNTPASELGLAQLFARSLEHVAACTR